MSTRAHAQKIKKIKREREREREREKKEERRREGGTIDRYEIVKGEVA